MHQFEFEPVIILSVSSIDLYAVGGKKKKKENCEIVPVFVNVSP